VYVFPRPCALDIINGESIFIDTAAFVYFVERSAAFLFDFACRKT